MMRKKIFAAVGMLLLVIGLCGAKSYMRQMKIRENEAYKTAWMLAK